MKFNRKEKTIQINQVGNVLWVKNSFCEVLFNVLSSDEKCVYVSIKNKKFRFYNSLTTSKIKNQDELELYFRSQLRCFQAYFIDNIEKRCFRYSDNLNKRIIIEDIKELMKCADIGNRDMLYILYEK